MNNMEGCIFCKIIKGEAKSDRIAENEDFLAIFDIHPKVRDHILIVSKKHFLDLRDMDDKSIGKMFVFAKEIGKDMMNKGYSGFNLVMNNGKHSGQIIIHAHCHLLPRRENDGFRIGV